MPLNVACCFWDTNNKSEWFSRCYSEAWVEKLCRGFKRNLTVPFRFVVFVDRKRDFKESGIHQELLATKPAHYGCLIEPFKLNEPTIICGLDTVVVRNVDHLARYCLEADKVALPGHPTDKKKRGFINPVVFAPKGFGWLYDEWRGENDMRFLQREEFVDANELWPGQLLSLKLHGVSHGVNPPPAARIIYFHGRSKPQQLGHVGWIKKHWQ